MLGSRAHVLIVEDGAPFARQLVAAVEPFEAPSTSARRRSRSTRVATSAASASRPRHRRARLSFVPLLALLFGNGCGCPASHGPGDGGAPHDGPPADIAFADAGPDVRGFLDAFAAALCEGFPRCDFEPLWESVELCAREHPFLSEILEPRYRLVPWGADLLVESGVVAFDPDAAAACLDEVRATCPGNPWLSPLTELPASCRRVFTPRRPRSEGEPCTYTFECAADAYCSSVDLACGWEQRCLARKPPGAPCEQDSQCLQPGGGRADCVPEDVGSDARHRCREVVPAAPAEEGAACGWLGELSDALVRTPCVPGLWCLLSFEAPRSGVCTRLPDGGEPCLPEGYFDLCAHEGDCDTTADRCVAWPVITAEAVGEPSACATGLGKLGFCSVSEELICVLIDGCVHWDRGVERSRCGGLAPCQAGLFCQSGYCVPGKAAGEMCLRNRQCASGCCVERQCVESSP